MTMCRLQLGASPLRFELAFPKEHLRGVDLRGQDVNLTIAGVAMEPVKCMDDRSGQVKWIEEQRLVARFRETDKKLIVNQTNAQLIATALGTGETDDWAGRRITVYPKPGKWFGKVQDALRVRHVAP